MYRQNHQRIGALLLSRSPALHTALARVLSTAAVDLDCVIDVERAIATLKRDCLPVVLIPSESNWHDLLHQIRELPDCPSVVVLLNAFDAEMWASALQQGAFEAVPVNAERDRLIDTVRRGFQRWERRRLVRAALDQNPLSHADLPY